MAVLNSNGYPTLLDQVKTRDPDGSVAKVVELLSQRNPLIETAVFMEGNMATGHRVTGRDGLPSGTWRMYNQGVAESKATTAQFDEVCGSLEGFSKVDVGLAKMYGDPAGYRQSQDQGFIQGLSNDVEEAFFYQSLITDPHSIMGLTPRMNSLSGANAAQIINAAGTGADQTSIWLVGWGADKVFGIYPKGSSGGLVPHDMGEHLVLDSNSRTFRAFVTHWQWQTGLCVADKRYLVRIANIDMGSISATDDTIVPLMIDALGQIQSINDCKPVFYVSRRLNTYLRKQARNATKNSSLTTENIGGRWITHLDGVPIHMADSILNTEAQVT